MRNPRPSSQRGFTLLEVLLAIGVSLSIGAVALTELRRTNESKQAVAVGQQAGTVGRALNTYLALQYTNIVSLNEVDGAGTAADPGPRHCTANATTMNGNPASICTITTDTLVRSGLLPSSFSGRNAFGADYNLYIRVAGASPNFIVEGLAVTNRPYTTGGGNRYDLLGQAMQEAGADAGITRTLANTLEGLNGTWSDANWPSVTHRGETYPGVNELGLLGYRSGYGSSGYAAYLRIDGTIPMTGNLDMDANDIRNVRQLEADTARLAGDRLMMAAGPCPADGSACPDDNPNRTELIAGGGALNIRNTGGVSIQNIDGTAAGNFAANDGQFDGTINANGDIRAVGNIEANDLTARNNISAAGTIQANGTIQGGAITTSGNGNITAGGTGTVQGYNVVGTNQVTGGTYNISAAGLRNGTQPAWFYDSAVTAWRTTAGIMTSGQTRTNTLEVDTTARVGQSLEIYGNAVNRNTACAPTEIGTLRRSNYGTLLQCTNNGWGWAWRDMTATITQVVSPYVSANNSRNSTTASCPAGTTVVGGGYQAGPYLPTGGGQDTEAPSASYPNGNGWTVVTGQSNGLGQTFRAFALCVS